MSAHPMKPEVVTQQEAAAKVVVDRILNEGPISLIEAARIMGTTGRGKPRSAASMARYCSIGLRGVRLEAFYGTNGWVTSEAAVRRFLIQLAAPTCVPTQPAAPSHGQGKAAGRQALKNIEGTLKRLKDSRKEKRGR